MTTCPMQGSIKWKSLQVVSVSDTISCCRAIVELLLSHEASTNIVDLQGSSPLHLGKFIFLHVILIRDATGT